MPTVQTHGHEMHFIEREGDGVPLLMVHSSGLNARQWVGLRSLLPGRPVLLPDLVGYGESSPWEQGDAFDWRVDVEGLEAILNTYEGPWDLVGHSYGGFLALLVASRNPDRIRRLSLHEPVAWALLETHGRPPDAQSYRDTVEGLFGSGRQLNPSAWMAYFVDFWNGPGAWEGLSEKRQAQWVAVASKVIPEVRAICFDETSAETWAQIQVPTLISVGKESPSLERAVCELLVDVIPQARLQETSGGHMAPITHGREVLEYHRAFVSES